MMRPSLRTRRGRRLRIEVVLCGVVEDVEDREEEGDAVVEEVVDGDVGVEEASKMVWNEWFSELVGCDLCIQ